MNLRRLQLFIMSHGFDAVIEGDCVKWFCPEFNLDTRETTLVTLYCRSFNTARDQLGY